MSLTDVGGGPLGPVLAARYGAGGCGADGGASVGVVVRGLAPGLVDVAWSLEVSRDAPAGGEATWSIGCDGDVHEVKYLSVDLPMRADGEIGVLRITLVDERGVEASAEHVFVGSVLD